MVEVNAVVTFQGRIVTFDFLFSLEKIKRDHMRGLARTHLGYDRRLA